MPQAGGRKERQKKRAKSEGAAPSTAPYARVRTGVKANTNEEGREREEDGVPAGQGNMKKQKKQTERPKC